MSSAATTQQIEKLGPWFHNIHLPDGNQTAPEHFLGDFPHYKWKQIAPTLPARMSGWKVLDIGCNAGYYSFELAKRGAEVTAIDIDDRYLQQARWAAKLLDLEDRIEFRQAAVYQLADEQQQYDLVWFMGVFYHLRYPLLALDIIRNCCKSMMIFQTMTAPGDEVFPVSENYGLEQRSVMQNPGWPRMAFIEHRLADDPTNWWAPNHACVEALLRAAGYADISRIAHEIYSCRVSPKPEYGATDLQEIFKGRSGQDDTRDRH